MLIEKCVVARTGLFQGNEFVFTKGINIIYGGNGTGKTLLAKGLLDVIAGSHEGSLLLDRDTLNSLYLDITITGDKNESLRIINNMDRYLRFEDSANNTLCEYKPGETAASSENYTEFLNLYRSLIPFPLTILKECCYVNSLSDDPEKNLISSGTLRSILLSDRSGFNLMAGLFENLTGANTPDTLINDNERTLRDIIKKIQLIEINHTRLKKLTNEKESVSAEIENIRSEIEQLSRRKTALISVSDDLLRIERLNAELESIKSEVECEKEKIENMTRIKSEAENSFPQFRDISIDDPDYLNSLQMIYIKIRNVNEKLDRFFIEKQSVKNISLISGAGINSALLAAGIASVFLSEGDNVNLTLAMLGLIAASVTLFIIFIYRLKTGISKYNQIVNEKQEIEEELKNLLLKGKFHLDGYRLDELYEFLLQYFEDYIAYMDIRNELDTCKAGLKDGAHLNQIRNKLEELNKEHKMLSGSIKEKLPDSADSHDIRFNQIFVEQELNRINGSSSELSIKLTSKESVLSQISIEIRSFREHTDELDTLNTMKNTIESELELLRGRKKLISLINDSITESAGCRINRLMKQLTSKTLDIFNNITDNRHVSEYDDIFINSMLNGTAKVESSGFRHMHLLLTAIKISLSEFFLDRDRPPPLIIDEPFQYIDEDRSSRLKKILEETSAKRQIIILTHHSGKEDWGNYIRI